MTDFSTLTQQIQEEMARPSALDVDRIWRAIIDSMRKYNYLYFFTQEKSATWTAQVDKNSYGNETVEGAGLGYPSHMVRPVVLYYIKDDAIYDPIPMTTIAQIRGMQDSITAQGLPNFFAWFGREFHMDRRAHQPFEFQLDYIESDFIPQYTYDGTKWVFTETSTGSPLPLTGQYSVPLTQFKTGELIKWSAEAYLARWLKDDSEWARANNLEKQTLLTARTKSTLQSALTITPPSS